jgi:signal transduction histidine kinase
VNRRLRAALIAGATVAMLCFFLSAPVWRMQSPYISYFVTTAAVGFAFLVAGIATWQRWPASRLGLLFTIVGYLDLVPNTLVNSLNSVAFTIALLTQTMTGAALAHLALAWPSGRLRSRFERNVVIAEYAWTIIPTLISTLFFKPVFSGCGSRCPVNLLLVSDSQSIGNIVGVVSLTGSLAIIGILVVLIVRHWRSARGWSRRAMTPLLWISAVVITQYVFQNLVDNLTLVVPNLAVNLAPLVLLTGPVLVIADALRARTARGAVGSAVVDLEPGATPDRLRQALARALGDSTLQLGLRQPESADYVDTAGLPLDLALLGQGRALTPLADPDGAVLVHDAGLEHEPQLLRLTAAAASMALEHSRLQAEVQAQLEQVRASRTRIVEAGDAARRRLERDLHDGAQQRLVTLSLALGLARSRAAGADPELESLIESATKEAAEALVELRELARGIHPAVLTETGLAGAVQALAERSPVVTTVASVPKERFPASVEATAYFVICEALANVAKHAMAGSAEVSVRKLPGRLVVEVSDDGAGGARSDQGSGLRGLADRVASARGSLRVDSPPGGGTRLEAEIPCP